MREFELLPNEEQIRDMAREYNMVKIRKDLYQGFKSAESAAEKVCATVDEKAFPRVDNINLSLISKPRLKDSYEKVSVDNAFHNERSQEALKNCQNDSCKAGREDNIVVADCNCESRNIPCTNNRLAIAGIEKCYYLERDLEQAMVRLHSVVPPIYRNNIAELIKIKKENTQFVLSTYTQLANQTLNYSPTLYNGRNFCATLAVVGELQDKLLSKLARLEECTQLMWVTSRELILATALNRMCIFCYFNKL